MHVYQDWATGDFDLFEFIGNDGSDQSFHGSQQGDQFPSSSGQQFDNPEKQEKDDYMYSVMQYNDMTFDNNQQHQMYGHSDMAGGFMQDDRYQQNSAGSGSLLNSTINKLHQQQQGQQPSTSRLSTAVNNQQSYASRMRPQLQSQMGQPAQLNGDLADSVLLPTSSQSPQNQQNGSMYLPQTMIKSEPQYSDMAGHDEYYSTSDTESHYSGHNRLATGGSGKPRKYRIKPEAERVTPQYRMKRAKNNDAVRRSREKAKHHLLEKEKRLQFLESEHNEHYKAMNNLKQRVRDLEAENMALRKNCSCVAAQQMPQFRR